MIEIPKVSIDNAKWARGVFTCPHCGVQLPEPHHVYLHAIGIAESNYGVMKVIECPYCFEKYYSAHLFVENVDQNSALNHPKAYS